MTLEAAIAPTVGVDLQRTLAGVDPEIARIIAREESAGSGWASS
jgi:hypothetical protein